MQPSNKWFPVPLQERAAWFQNFAAQFNQIGTGLGFLPSVLTQVQNDNTDFQFCADQTVEVEAFAKAFRLYRQTVTEGHVGDPAPQYPTNPSAAPPSQVPTGIFERLDDLVKQIRVANTYTPEIGALLGIIPAPPGNLIPPDELQPTLKATTLPGSVVQVKFVRGSTNGVMIEMKLDNAVSWSDAGKFYSSPAQLTVPENAENLPRSVQLRARYVEGNGPVGLYSDIVATVTLPQA
ncbi:MAG: hypothetical protein AB7F88_12650 [Pyrinomonadaceae bacterium]